MSFDPITAGIDFGKELLGIAKRYIPDPEKAQQFVQDAMTLQMGVNAIEAAHKSVLVAGWRPFIGWVCGSSLALYYIPRIILTDILWVWACMQAGHIVPYPELPLSDLVSLLTGMLGFGLLRSLEKNNK